MIHDPALAHRVHFFFEWAALAGGTAVYRLRKRRQGQPGLTHPSSFPMLVGCLVGAALGNKAVFWLEYPQLWAAARHTPALWLQGQSIVGGLLGGWIGVELAKWLTGWRGPRTGDDFVPAILTGIVIGRIGCFLAGLNDGTYGIATRLPWGIDFGDGIPRHPTQLYEWLAAFLALVTWPRWHPRFAATPGLAFRVFMLGYLLWRLLIDSLKPVPYAYTFGWSGIQYLCAIALLIILAWQAIDQAKQKHLGKNA